jgi:hypothetical protein
MNETKFACGEICFTDVKWDFYLRPMINRQKIIFSIRFKKKKKKNLNQVYNFLICCT